MNTEQKAKELYGWDPRKTSLSAREYIMINEGRDNFPPDARDASPFDAMAEC